MLLAIHCAFNVEVVNVMSFMDKTEKFFTDSAASRFVDAASNKILDTTFAVNEALGPAGSDKIDIVQRLLPYAEQAISTPNSEIKEKLKSLGEAIGKAMNEASSSSELQAEIEAKLSPVREEQSYGK